MVKILIDAKADVLDIKNYEGKTALFLTSEKNGRFLYKKIGGVKIYKWIWFLKLGAESLIKYLIDKGADVNTRDDLEQTPLHWCGETGKFGILIAKTTYSSI